MKFGKFILTSLLLFFAGIIAQAQTLQVAAAANLQSVIKALGADFKKQTGIEIQPITGSSGNLVNQIKNGAPFDVFLSADISFPESLYKAGFSMDEPVVYAWGNLIVCSRQKLDLKNWQSLLQKGKVKKIAIANAAIAPYGKAAEEALIKTGIMNSVKPKLVYGESIAQVNTYITTGAVTVGFTSQSFIKDADKNAKLYWAPVDVNLYTAIQQGMVILKHGKETNFENAQKFYKYILSPSAKAIFTQYGYHVQ
ncbi:molybdate ABC transporter substrate-binding protein [Mucilaginibacter sp. PPCGB 2223]|uniref:molybdate ABC transporter substrate-binding protein n=1 Tax=Mucilaginibacter sp. PPCGB 2223 TaxID=1886027 RepID=UPI0008242E04|nr:molybdate ABC transporter substrate-binding protein [Mucilaginibacter sp. PPCGB 2223]OCX54769.1 molybdate ABC transporter substrate-binding protein [Mucilaginibacter sp. PPCGB 2223]